MTDIEIQLKYCSNSRQGKTETPSRMGKRVLRNVEEAYETHFSKYDRSILDVGCGDALSVARFNQLGAHAAGIEYVPERVTTAQSHGLEVIQGSVEDLNCVQPYFNIFCSHVLEHVRNQEKAVKEIQRVAGEIIYILVPIEAGKDAHGNPRSGNAAHFSPVGSLKQLRNMFDDSIWECVQEEYRFDLEPVGILVMQRKQATPSAWKG